MNGFNDSLGMDWRMDFWWIIGIIILIVIIVLIVKAVNKKNKLKNQSHGN